MSHPLLYYSFSFTQDDPIGDFVEVVISTLSQRLGNAAIELRHIFIIGECLWE